MLFMQTNIKNYINYVCGSPIVFVALNSGAVLYEHIYIIYLI